MQKLISTNPARGFEVNGEINISTKKEIAKKVLQANNAKNDWKKLGIKRRIESA